MTQSSDRILERMMALHPKLIDLTLDRVWRLLAALGNPQDALPPVVHIAGTNGKGSTTAMLRAGFEGDGALAHAYTSPHLVRFHERIRLAGQLIEEDALAAVLDECYTANGDVPITYFEITTCAALLAMARVPADVTLLEVGLGGRLDATNVIAKPALTVITPISMDHEQFLGDTLDKIAFEKAGILKRGVTCVVGRQDPQALAVIEAQAARVGAPLLTYGEHWRSWEEHGRLVVEDDTGLRELPLPNLPGAHQIGNAGMAVVALRHLQRGEAALDAAVRNANWPGRLQRLRHGPFADIAGGRELWLDGGHNPAAGAILRDFFKKPGPPLHIVCGMLSTKDAHGFLMPLQEIAAHLTAVPIPGVDSGLDETTLAEVAQNLGIPADTAPDAVSALRHVPQDARILICGSLYFVGAVLRDSQDAVA